MLITKREEVTKQGFCKMLWRKLRPQRSLLLELIHSSDVGRVGVSACFSLIRRRRGWALIRSRALIRINTLNGPSLKNGYNLQHYHAIWLDIRRKIQRGISPWAILAPRLPSKIPRSAWVTERGRQSNEFSPDFETKVSWRAWLIIKAGWVIAPHRIQLPKVCL